MFGMNPVTLFIVAIFILIGMIAIVVGLFNLLKASASTRWPSTNGQVTASNVRVSTSTDNEGSTSTSYVPHIEYEYVVNDTNYTSHRRSVGTGERGYGSRNRANAAAEQYPVGKSVSVYYDPQNPKYAVLETGFSMNSFVFLIIGIVFICVSVALGIFYSSGF